MPKMQFPRFEGQDPTIWRDKCETYFQIFYIPDHMKIMTAVMHVDENASRWFRVYKRKSMVETWDQFIKAVEQKFGAYDYQHTINELLDLKQIGSVEEYAAAF